MLPETSAAGVLAGGRVEFSVTSRPSFVVRPAATASWMNADAAESAGIPTIILVVLPAPPPSAAELSFAAELQPAASRATAAPAATAELQCLTAICSLASMRGRLTGRGWCTPHGPDRRYLWIVRSYFLASEMKTGTAVSRPPSNSGRSSSNSSGGRMPTSICRPMPSFSGGVVTLLAFSGF
jgi:hypothetical protein